MDIQHLVRDPEKIHGCFKKVDNKLIVTHPCKIYIPEYYMGSSLGSMGDVIKIVAIFAIVMDDHYYAVSSACAMVEIEPTGINIVTINNAKFFEFSFLKNDVFIKNLNLIKINTIVYRIYNEITSGGKVPWYFSIVDLCRLYDTANIHAGVNLDADSALFELMAMVMSRQKSNKALFYRHALHSSNSDKDKPVFIPLKSVAYNATNTQAKILGPYFNEGLTSALVNPATEVESVESLLLK